MNKKKISLLVIVFGIMLLAVGWYRIFESNKKSQSEMVNIENGIYSSKSAGWSIKIPDGWTLLPNVNNEIKEMTVSKYEKFGVDVSSLYSTEWLIGFQKDKYNFFRAFYEDNPQISEEHLMESMVIHREMVSRMFPAGWVVTNVSSIITEYVDGHKFLMFSINASIPESNKILSAISYAGIINDKYFGVTIYSTTVTNKNTLMTAWLKSKFI